MDARDHASRLTWTLQWKELHLCQGHLTWKVGVCGSFCFGLHIMIWVVPPPRMPVANEGLGWDPLLKMFHNPGGDWHPGRGDNPNYDVYPPGNDHISPPFTVLLSRWFSELPKVGRDDMIVPWRLYLWYSLEPLVFNLVFCWWVGNPYGKMSIFTHCSISCGVEDGGWVGGKCNDLVSTCWHSHHHGILTFVTPFFELCHTVIDPLHATEKHRFQGSKLYLQLLLGQFVGRICGSVQVGSASAHDIAFAQKWLHLLQLLLSIRKSSTVGAYRLF